VTNILDNTKQFGGGKGSAIFHLYENVVRQDDNTGYDKLLHFTFSASYTYKTGHLTSKILGYTKEIVKDET
jgi:hypothetical protein